MAENYFGAIVELADKFKRLDQRVLINSVIRQVPAIQRLIIELNTKGQPTSQLFELNVDSEGLLLSQIGGDYADFTLFEAERLGRPKKDKQSINLHDTGKYYDSFRISIPSLSADYVDIIHDTSTDDGDLADDWGPDLAGLIQFNADIVADFALPFFQNEFQRLVA